MRLSARFLFLAGLFGAAAHAHAEVPLTLQGKLTQGALVIGRTEPGATVTLDGQPLAVDRDGAFALGFDRDAKPHWTLTVTTPSGVRLERTIAVAPRQFAIQRISGIAQRYVEPPPELMQRLEREYFLVRKVRETMSDLPFWRTGFVWPVVGRISGVFGSQRIINGKPLRPHYGVDVAAVTGTPIRAAAAGTVTLAYDQLYFSGRTVIIDHGLGVSTHYIHMHEIRVREGQRVRQGEIIGTVGTTGRSSGPHLHWGLNWRQTYLDPMLVAGPMPRPKAAPKPGAGKPN